jgi:hypothetical protein
MSAKKAFLEIFSRDQATPNNDMLSQRKNPDRVSACDCASWISSLSCITPSLNGLQILIFQGSQLWRSYRHVDISHDNEHTRSRQNAPQKLSWPLPASHGFGLSAFETKRGAGGNARTTSRTTNQGHDLPPSFAASSSSKTQKKLHFIL